MKKAGVAAKHLTPTIRLVGFAFDLRQQASFNALKSLISGSDI